MNRENRVDGGLQEGISFRDRADGSPRGPSLVRRVPAGPVARPPRAGPAIGTYAGPATVCAHAKHVKERARGEIRSERNARRTS